MGSLEIGIYFQTLLQLQGKPIIDACMEAGVSHAYISKLLHGNIKEPSATTMSSFVHVTRGSWDDIDQLLPAKATRDLAVRLAKARHENAPPASADSPAVPAASQVGELVSTFYQLDEGRRMSVLGYLRRIAEEEAQFSIDQVDSNRK